ncbi:hypothetical protein GCM10023259_060740 [Thermocatellispora tengchongensis]
MAVTTAPAAHTQPWWRRREADAFPQVPASPFRLLEDPPDPLQGARVQGPGRVARFMGGAAEADGQDHEQRVRRPGGIGRSQGGGEGAWVAGGVGEAG